MFFLLRLAFWIGLVLVLLPTDKTPDSDKAPQIGASDAISAASAAVSDMSQFCTRQPAACAVGGQAASAIGARAQSGARKVYQFITEKKAAETADKEKKAEPAEKDKKAPEHTGSIGPREPLHGEGFDPFRDTLTLDDRKIDTQAALADPFALGMPLP